MRSLLSVFSFLILSNLFVVFPANSQLSDEKISLDKHNMIVEGLEKKIETLGLLLQRYQENDLENKILLPDGAYLRDGWFSAEKENCGIYGRDEWVCKRHESKGGLDDYYWGVGCIRESSRCQSGKAISVAAAWSNRHPNRFPEEKGCVQQWIRWECGTIPISQEQHIKDVRMGKYNNWLEEVREKGNKYVSQ